MNLISLRYFVAVAESGSISQAARSLYTSQQVVSDHIRRLEEHYKTPLLTRTRPITLTPSGELLLETSRLVLSTMEHLEHRIQTTTQSSKDRLVISVGRTRIPPFAEHLFLLFQQKMPHTELVLMHPNSTDVVWTSPPPEADILLGDFPFDSGTDTIEFFSDPFCLVISESLLNSVLGPVESGEDDRTTLSPSQLDTIYQNVSFHLIPDQVGSLPLLPLNASRTLDKLDLVIYLCRTGQCASLLPYNYASHLFSDAPQVKIYPLLEKGMSKRVGMCTSRGKAKTAATRAFIHVAQEYFSTSRKKPTKCSVPIPSQKNTFPDKSYS